MTTAPGAASASATTAQASVLYDAPGPRARARYRLYGLLSTVVLAALLAYVLWRFYDTGQFSGRKWEIFQYKAVQESLLRGLVNTLRAAAVAAVLALALGTVLAAARISDHAAVRAPAVLVVEFFRAVLLVILTLLLLLRDAPARLAGLDVLGRRARPSALQRLRPR